MGILVFGDSTAQGYYDLEAGGWVNRLFIDLMKRTVRRPDNPVEILNVSISGDTTERIIARLEAEVASRRWENEPIVLVFAVGVNDAMLDDGEPISTPEKYRLELGELYRIARSCAQAVVFVGLVSVNEDESVPWRFNDGTHELSWENDRIRLFDAALRDFAHEMRADFVDVFEAFREQQRKGVCLHADGLHPNKEGHELMYRLIKPVVDEVVSRLTH